MRTFETKVIGGIVRGLVPPSSVSLYPSDFEDKELGQCLALARDIETAGREVDPDILALRCIETDNGFFSTDDFTLMANSIQSASVVYEAIDRIKAQSLRNRLLAETAEIGLRKDASGVELLRDLRRVISDAERFNSSENGFVYLKDIGIKTRGVIDDLHNRVAYAVPTGFGNFDDLLGDGFSKGDEHIIVGHTGSGKSALALACARNQAATERVVGIVSREMADTENHIRILASETNIPRYSIRNGMSDFTHRDLAQGIERTNELRIAFDTTTSTVEELRPRVRQMCESDGMQILYVDYLQLMSSNAIKGTNRADEVQKISRTLKEIAMENRIPVVSLCQFNRGAMNASLFEILSHLKESSGIEQDASTVSYVQIERTEEPKQIKEAKVTILKNRNGATFQSAHFDYDGAVFKFIERPSDRSF